MICKDFRQDEGVVIADKGVQSKSQRLQGRRVAFGICGGIGAVETIKPIRELRRHGAEITVFLTPSATEFITELSVGWASGHDPVVELDREVDHLDPFDLVLVAPVTLHSLSKFALGLSDNAVSLLVASQLGRRFPVALVPAMNLQLREHPLYGEYRKTLENWGVYFYPSPEEEGRLKMPDAGALTGWAMEVLESWKSN